MENTILYKEELIDKVIEYIDKSNIQFIVIFGSILKDSFNNESDIDIGIMFKSDTDFFEARKQISLNLYELINNDLDIVALNTADIIITMQIIANGKLMYCENNENYTSFKVRKLSEYADFKQSRQWLENNFLNHKVYARS